MIGSQSILYIRMGRLDSVVGSKSQMKDHIHDQSRNNSLIVVNSKCHKVQPTGSFRTKKKSP